MQQFGVLVRFRDMKVMFHDRSLRDLLGVERARSHPQNPNDCSRAFAVPASRLLQGPARYPEASPAPSSRSSPAEALAR